MLTRIAQITRYNKYYRRAHTRTRIAGFVDERSTSELSDRLMRNGVFNETLYLDSTQIEVFEFKFLKKNNTITLTLVV